MEVDLESGEDEEDEGEIEKDEEINDNDDNVIVAESVSDEDD